MTEGASPATDEISRIRRRRTAIFAASEAGGVPIRLPRSTVGPLRAIVRRVLFAIGVLFFVILLVYFDRDGYRDVNEDGVSFLDAAYYTTVSLSTTGYGDITPTSDGARLVNFLIITPLRVMFLIVLVGTTLEVLTERGREQLRRNRWRSKVREHVVVCGYGTTGRSAVRALRSAGTPPEQIVVVDISQLPLDAASAAGYAVVGGSSTRSEVLREAQVERARAVVVATERDDTAVLTVLTARELAPKATISVSVRESENAHLLRQSGADTVVISAETSGRLLGLSTDASAVVDVVEDLLTSDTGLMIFERQLQPEEIGRSPRTIADPVLAVVRAGTLLRYNDADAVLLREGDRVICVGTK